MVWVKMKKIIANKALVLNVISMTIFIVIISFTFRSNPISTVLPTHDSSMFLYFGRGIHNGMIPYVNMYDHKGSVLFYVNSLAYLFGQGYAQFLLWIIEVLFLTTTVILLYKILNYLLKNSYLVCLTIWLSLGLFIELFAGGNFSEEYALPFILVALYGLIKYLNDDLENHRKLSLFLVGFSGSVVLFIRANMIAIWCIFGLVLLINLLTSKNRRGSDLLIPILGGLFGICLFTLIAFMSSSTSEMIQQVFIANIKYADSTLLDKRVATQYFIDFLIKYGLITLVISGIAVKISRYTELTTKQKKTFIWLIGYFIVNWLTVVASGRNYQHYLITQIPAILIFVGFALEELIGKKTNKWHYLLVIAILMMSIQGHALYEQGKTALVVNNSKQFETNRGIKRVSNYIKQHSTNRDSIYVHNLDANIYLESNRVSNSRFFVLPSLDYQKFPKISKEFRDSFIKRKPRFIVVSNSISQQPDFRFNGFIKALCDHQYKRVYVDTSGLSVFELK